MHDPAYVVSELVVGALLVIVLSALFVLIRSRARQQFFAGPRLHQWEQARRRLHRTDQWRVIWATRRNHPASRAMLADAQLAYVRFLQDAARRALGASRWRRAVPPTAFLVAAGLDVWAAATTRTPQRIVHSVLAAFFAISALLWALTDRQAGKRLAERMTWLETKIEDRHAR